MSDMASTRREAALALSPEDVATGITLLEALIAKASRKAKQLNKYFASGLFVTTLMLPVGFGFGFAGLVTEGTRGLLTAISMACIGLWGTGTAALWWSWTAIQTNSRMHRFGKIPDLELPSPLQNLIGLYASGARELRTDAGSVVPAAMFASQWAILLFSEDQAERQLVRSPTGVKEVRPVLVLPDVAVLPSEAEKDDSDGEREAYSGYRAVRGGEAPLRNHNPEMAWLVAGTSKQFREGREKFVATLDSHKVEPFRLILDVARHELRQGGQQEEVIRTINKELRKKHLAIRGTGRTKIMDLLHGNYCGKDIRGFFST
ncbi:hypothetical protein [Parerythrobacter lacustris]|uniref:Uncharacterized protein n=1 Tax=Parerythrobacter lacustris TaxID=2969984 RepID=A0ABT1XRD2_9SPHN|nr:hypothetical protein [Parerythrobacter lacustris]MCR2833819.1 hypothetical protein [Parerythrobacter lacustris]